MSLVERKVKFIVWARVNFRMDKRQKKIKNSLALIKIVRHIKTFKALLFNNMDTISKFETTRTVPSL